MNHKGGLLLGLGLLLASIGAEGGSAEQGPVSFLTIEASDDYEWVRDNLKQAILARGLVISGELPVGGMLDRTAADLGFDERVFLHAETIEFCSAMMAHRMALADPRNIALCPFSLSVYVLADDPERVFVTYPLPSLVGDSADVAVDITAMLEEIAHAAAE